MGVGHSLARVVRVTGAPGTAQMSGSSRGLIGPVCQWPGAAGLLLCESAALGAHWSSVNGFMQSAHMTCRRFNVVGDTRITVGGVQAHVALL